MQQFQPFRRYLFGSLGHPRDVGAWPAQASHDAEPDRVGAVSKTIGMTAVAALAARAAGVLLAAITVTCRCTKSTGHSRQSVVVPRRPSEFDLDVLALDQTHFTQALPKRRHSIGVGQRRTGTEETDHRHSRLLRARRERPAQPSRRAA